VQISNNGNGLTAKNGRKEKKVKNAKGRPIQNRERE
jgi:hypothetical protein